MVEPGLMERDHVHVAFDHHRIALLARGVAGVRQAEQHPAFMEERVFRRVEVFRLAVAHHAAAEGDHAPAPVHNRKQDAATKIIVGVAAAFRPAQQPDLERAGLFVILGRQHALEPAAIVGREAQAEAGDRLVGQAAVFEIGQGRAAGGGTQLLLEPGTGRFDHGVKRLLLLGPLAVLRRHARHGDAGLLGQPLDSLGKGQALGPHDEADDVAVRTAAEAMEEALVLVKGEGRRFLVVERAQPDMLAAALLQAHAAAHRIGQADTGAQFVEELDRKRHCSRRSLTSLRRADIRAPRIQPRCFFTTALALAKSICPAKRSLSTPMTRPMSLIPEAPNSPISPFTA